MKKEWMIVGLVALTLAGCGSSSSSSSGGSTASQAPATSTPTQTSSGSSAGHTSEWSSAETAQAESDLAKESKGEGLSAAFKQCLVKGVEEVFSPAEYTKDNAENKEAGKARGIAEKCAKEHPPTAK